MAHRDEQGDHHGDDHGRRRRRSQRAGDPETSRPRALRGAGVPLRQMGPHDRPGGTQRRRRGHGRFGHPVRAGDPGKGRQAVGLPANPALLDHAATQSRAQRPRTRRLQGRCRLSRSSPARADLRRHRGLRPRLPAPEAHLAPLQRRRRGLSRQVHPGPGAPRETDAELHARLQAHPLFEQVPSRPRARERRGRHRRHPRGPRELDRDQRRARASGRHDHLRHRLPRDRPAVRQVRDRPRRQDARRGLEGKPAGASRHDGVRVFRISFLLLPARTRVSATRRSST